MCTDRQLAQFCDPQSITIFSITNITSKLQITTGAPVLHKLLSTIKFTLIMDHQSNYPTSAAEL